MSLLKLQPQKKPVRKPCIHAFPALVEEYCRDHMTNKQLAEQLGKIPLRSDNVYDRIIMDEAIKRLNNEDDLMKQELLKKGA